MSSASTSTATAPAPAAIPPNIRQTNLPTLAVTCAKKFMAIIEAMHSGDEIRIGAAKSAYGKCRSTEYVIDGDRKFDAMIATALQAMDVSTILPNSELETTSPVYPDFIDLDGEYLTQHQSCENEYFASHPEQLPNLIFERIVVCAVDMYLDAMSPFGPAFAMWQILREHGIQSRIVPSYLKGFMYTNAYERTYHVMVGDIKYDLNKEIEKRLGIRYMRSVLADLTEYDHPPGIVYGYAGPTTEQMNDPATYVHGIIGDDRLRERANEIICATLDEDTR